MARFRLVVAESGLCCQGQVVLKARPGLGQGFQTRSVRKSEPASTTRDWGGNKDAQHEDKPWHKTG
jgi:hypothetical protein